MTRAKSELLMTWRQTVPIFSSGGLKNVDRPRSRFLDVLVSKKPQASSLESATTPKPKKWNEKYRSAQDKASQIKNWSSSSDMRKFGTLPIGKFTGTASVYASNANNMIDTLSTKTVFPKRPSAPFSTSKDQKVSPSIQTQNTANDSILIRATSYTTGSKGDASPNKSGEARRNSEQAINSNWFFPIGSKVRHKIFGDGVVLTPLTTSGLGSMRVLVEFKNGEKQEFPVQTTELSPIATK